MLEALTLIEKKKTIVASRPYNNKKNNYIYWYSKINHERNKIYLIKKYVKQNKRVFLIVWRLK